MLRLLLLAALVLAPAAHAQTRDASAPRVSPNASLSQTFGFTDIDLTYGRPAVRERNLFAGPDALEPYGELWRAGANEATTITFSTDVNVEGQPLAAGTYALFAVPGPETWTLVFNRDADQWGEYGYDEAQDALRVDVRAQQTPEFAEQLRYRVEGVSDQGATVLLEWGDVRVPFQVAADFEGVLMARGEAADTWQSATTFANLAAEHELGRDVVMRWSDKAVALGANFYTHRARAVLLARYGDLAGALAAADAALAAAPSTQPAVNARNIERLEAQRAEWMGQIDG
jgi:hypothetical protein